MADIFHLLEKVEVSAQSLTTVQNKLRRIPINIKSSRTVHLGSHQNIIGLNLLELIGLFMAGKSAKSEVLVVLVNCDHHKKHSLLFHITDH